jgi:PPP family 3-phenylpropionic acid transporter
MQMPQAARRKRELLLAPKIFYFGWFAAIGVYAPFVTLYYLQSGLDLTQIGLLLAISGVIQIVAAPIWAVAADTLHLHRVLLPVAMVGTLIPVALMGFVTGFFPLLILASLYALFTAPITPLGDNAVLNMLGDRRDRYGAQRAWGAAGWGLSTIISGIVIERMGLGVMFWAYPLTGIVPILAALALPKAALVTVNIASAARTLVRDIRWARFLICTLLVGCAGALVHGFLSIYFAELGAGKDMVGLAFTIASVSELPVMALAPIALRRWGPRPLLLCAGVAYAIRMLLFGIAPGPEWALAAQLLHGFCFATIWIAGVHEAQRLAPRGLEATAQSLFVTTMFGVSGVVANSVGGVIYQSYGYGVLFAAAGILALCGAAGFLLPVAEPAPQPAEAQG